MNTMQQLAAFTFLATGLITVASAAPNDWAEGTGGRGGASRDYYGDIWVWQRGYRGFLEKNRWYCIEQQVKLNQPERNDGLLRAWVDGRLAFEKTDIRFRTVATLKIEQVWMNVYHGGTKPSPYDQHLYIDNVVVARKYIGPRRER